MGADLFVGYTEDMRSAIAFVCVIGCASAQTFDGPAERLFQEIAAGASARESVLARVSLVGRWRDEGKMHWNVGIFRRDGGKAVIERGHDLGGQRRSILLDYTLNYLNGEEYIQVKPLERVIGRRPVENPQEIPIAFASFPFFVACAWWPSLAPKNHRLTWYGNPVDISDTSRDAGYKCSLEEDLCVLTKEPHDRIVLLRSQQMRLVERTVRPEEGPRSVRVLVKDVVLVDGAWLPHGFRLEWTDNDQHGYLEGVFDSVRTSCGSCAFDGSWLHRPGTCAVNADGTIGPQIVPGGIEMLSEIARAIHSSFAQEHPEGLPIASFLTGSFLAIASVHYSRRRRPQVIQPVVGRSKDAARVETKGTLE